jgi:AcrR family transcriptional regulator
VQAAVHKATQELLDEIGRNALTVPLIAARAGVTPSTIYRRWGELPDLLADVAMQRLRPECEPADTGALRSDLQNWAEQYLEEMSSDIGLAMMRDVLSGGATESASQCAAITANQIQIVLERAIARGEAVPEVEAIMDGVVAPIIYRTLFSPAPATHAHVHMLLDGCLKQAKRKKKIATKA